MNKKQEEIATQIMNIARNGLAMKYRYLDKAICCLKLRPEWNVRKIETDGRYIYFNPSYIIEMYKECKNAINRLYLHQILHSVFIHFYIPSLINERLWNLACDISVENSINDLSDLFFETRRERILAQKAAADDLARKVKYLFADKLYDYFLKKKLPDEYIQELEDIYSYDSHDVWYQVSLRLNINQNESDSDQNIADSCMDAHLTSEWKDISRQMKMDLETFSLKKGNATGSLIQNLKALTKEKYDYTAFLKQFMVYGEQVKISEDEFDYIFYTYGLNHYDRMPFIEPLEYRENKVIKELVIAIDTSGSTSGELVQTFLNKTYNIINCENAFAERFILHIIQCDYSIKEDVRINNKEELDTYLENMTIKGLGGTDFRPVFSYVDELIDNHEFTNLKGLIYFTDGYGLFPEKMPEYETAIVFIDEGYEQPDVPPWVIKLVLEPGDIEAI